MYSYACGVTSNALVQFHAFPCDKAVLRLHSLWGDIKLPLVTQMINGQSARVLGFLDSFWGVMFRF